MTVMDTLWQDFRFGLRVLRRARGFSAIAVLVLTVAIGGVASMFTVVNALMFRPVAAKNPEELVRLYDKEKKPEGGYRSFSYPNFVDLREKNTAFSQLTAFTMTMVGLDEGDLTKRSFAALIPANYFDTFGVRMAAGRAFLPEEERPGSGAQVVIVSHGYWVAHGSDPGLVGKTLRINSRSFQVVGIAPQHFTGTSVMFSFDYWLPLGVYEMFYDPFANKKNLLTDRQNHGLMLVGRLKPELSIAAAQSQLQAVARQLEQAYPESNKDRTIEVGKMPRININTNPVKDPASGVLFVFLMGMPAVVLLIACLNLANMLLARGGARRKEIAIRLALGAGRARVIRQLLAEGFALALLGGAGGLWVAYFATQLLATSLAPKLGFLAVVFDARPDWRILSMTLFFCVLSVLVFSLGPALRLSRPEVMGDLKEQVGEQSSGRFSRSLFAPRNLLVIGQLALSLVLLTVAGLFAHGALVAARANPGFSFDRSLLAETDASLAGYDEAHSKQAYLELLERLRGLPGVESASLAYLVPFSLFNDAGSVQRAGAASAPAGGQGIAKAASSVSASFNIIGTEYFKTLGLPLLRGREFDAVETSANSDSRVAIIDEPLAKQLWPGEDPVGRQIRYDDKLDLQVVGVVAGVRNDLDDKEAQAHLYVPFGQDYRPGMNLHLRLKSADAGSEAAMLKLVRQTIHAYDPRLPILSVQMLSQFHQEGLLLWFKRTAAWLFGAFGALALFLAVVGVYGVRSYVTARRTREFGIRMALGASASDVLWMVLREGIALTGAGIGLGLLIAIAASLVLRSFLYGLGAVDPFSFGVATLSLTITTLAACYFPARRATRVQPMAALRCE